MIAQIEEANTNALPKDVIIGSLDVKALYPSLDLSFTIEKVCTMFRESEVVFEGVDYEEVGLYISLHKNLEELKELGLEDVCPTRQKNKGRPPTITSSGSKKKKEQRFQHWIKPSKSPSPEQMRLMLSTALKIGLYTVMENHIYSFRGVIRKQEKGGAIGLELTGALSQVFMLW